MSDVSGDNEGEYVPAFEAASDYVAGLASRGDPSLPASALLQFYGLYKQATVGDNTTDKPSIFNPSARAKWSAWKQVEGMPQSRAKRDYVALLRELQPQWNPTPAGGGKQGVGPVFSSLALTEEGSEQGDVAMPALHAAASRGDEAEVQQLVSDGADTNSRDGEGCSPLHWAADKGHIQVILLLLQQGADADAQDGDGLTPLFYAALSGHRKAAEVLLQHGADATIRNAEGETAKDAAPPGWDFLS